MGIQLSKRDTDAKKCQKKVQRVTVTLTCIIAIDDFYLLTNAIVFQVWMLLR